jgi:hypothetical protein
MHGEMPLFSLQECLAKAKHFTELVMETIRLTKLIDSSLKFRVWLVLLDLKAIYYFQVMIEEEEEGWMFNVCNRIKQ